MRAVLTDLQLEILTAGDGEEALECIESDAPAMIMLDWILPGMSGLEVCQRVRQRNSPERPYIVVLTFRDKDDDVVAVQVQLLPSRQRRRQLAERGSLSVAPRWRAVHARTLSYLCAAPDGAEAPHAERHARLRRRGSRSVLSVRS